MIEAVLDIKQWGNSLGVRLPAAVAREAHLHVDQRVRISYDYIQLIVLDPVNDRKLGNTIKFPRIVRDQCHAQT